MPRSGDTRKCRKGRDARGTIVTRASGPSAATSWGRSRGSWSRRHPIRDDRFARFAAIRPAHLTRHGPNVIMSQYLPYGFRYVSRPHPCQGVYPEPSPGAGPAGSVTKYMVSQIRTRISGGPLPNGRGSDRSWAQRAPPQQAICRYATAFRKRSAKSGDLDTLLSTYQHSAYLCRRRDSLAPSSAVGRS